MLDYLQTSTDNKFIWDTKLSIDLSRYNIYYKWDNYDTKCFDPVINDWIDNELDIADIPPSIFFMAVVNTYCTGFNRYIPRDESLMEFSKHVILDIKRKLIDSSYDLYDRIPYITSESIDLRYLNATGKIKSTKQWNAYMSKSGFIWINNMGILGSIQGIIKSCRSFLKSKSIKSRL